MLTRFMHYSLMLVFFCTTLSVDAADGRRVRRRLNLAADIAPAAQDPEIIGMEAIFARIDQQMIAIFAEMGGNEDIMRNLIAQMDAVGAPAANNILLDPVIIDEIAAPHAPQAAPQMANPVYATPPRIARYQAALERSPMTNPLLQVRVPAPIHPGPIWLDELEN